MKSVLVFCALAASAVACGDPAGPGDDDAAITFTPVPVYTVAGPDRDGILYSLKEDCGVFVADEVIATVPSDQAEAFETWLGASGFAARQSVDALRGSRFLVAVPPGSVPDAVTFIGAFPHVITVGPNSVAAIPEATSVAEILRCGEDSGE
jgi:hypothetical protein